MCDATIGWQRQLCSSLFIDGGWRGKHAPSRGDRATVATPPAARPDVFNPFGQTKSDEKVVGITVQKYMCDFMCRTCPYTCKKTCFGIHPNEEMRNSRAAWNDTYPFALSNHVSTLWYRSQTQPSLNRSMVTRDSSCQLLERCGNAAQQKDSSN